MEEREEKVYEGEDKYHCPKCDRVFDTKAELRNHKRTAH